MHDDLYQRIPKAELHVHLEGCLEPEQVLTFARRNAIALAQTTVEDIRRLNRFDGLSQFLAIMAMNSASIRTEADIYDIAFGYLSRAYQENIVHAEMAFSPQGPAQRGVPHEAVFEGLIAAFRDAKEAYGITGGPILACLRHRPSDEALDMLRTYGPKYRDDILAIGLHGAEDGFPPAMFEDCFELGRSFGWHAVAHAGEEGPSEYIWQAIDTLQVDRIDHGVGCLDDLALVERLRNDRTPMTVCPLSNVHLKVFKSLEEHNFHQLLAAGLNISLHTDDPAYFNGYLSEHYRLLSRAGLLDMDTLRTVQRNAFASAFMDPTKMEAMTRQSDELITAASSPGSVVIQSS